MSYILDALRKSERERQAGQVPGLPNLVVDSPRRYPAWLYWLAGLLLAVNLAGLGYWLWNRPAPVPVNPAAPADKPAASGRDGAAAYQPLTPPTPPAAAADRAPLTERIQQSVQTPPASPPSPSAGYPAVDAAQPVPPQPVRPQTLPPAITYGPGMMPTTPQGQIPPSSATPVPVSPPAGQTPPQIQASPAPAANPPAQASSPPSRDNRHGVSAESWPDDQSRRREYTASRRLAPVTEANDDAENADDEDDAVAAAESPEVDVPEQPVRRARNGIPYLEDMPTAFRERIPPFRISMYAYSREPEERFVIIDMKKYRAGDRVLGGALLLEIQPDNLMLELDGNKFRIPRT